MKTKDFFIPAIILLALILRLYLLNFVPAIKGILAEPVFLTDLLGSGKAFPYQFIIFCGLINTVLIWYLGKLLFNKKIGFLASLIYAISPWAIYLEIAGSFYIFLLSCFLLSGVGFALLNNKKIGPLLIMFGFVSLLYTNILMLFMVPLIAVFVLKKQSVNRLKLKVFLISFLLLCLPLPFLMVNNIKGVKNLLNNHIKIFSDVGLSNSVRDFQGEAKLKDLGQLAKLTENKYVFYAKYTTLKIIKNFVPSTYFTPQETLLKFSFSPPIYFGFLIPFLCGLYLILNSSNTRKYFAASLTLLMPAFLSKELVDLNRLVLFEPVVIFIISLGIIKIDQSKKERIFKFIMFLTIILVLIQFLVTIFDINFREYERFERYFGGSLQIGEQ